MSLPQIGDTISGIYGSWTLLARDGYRIRVGRQAERGWYEQDDYIGRFPGIQWEECPTCSGPAQRYVKGVPHFDCCTPR